MSGISRRQFLAAAVSVRAGAAQGAEKKRLALAPVLGLCSASLGLKDPSVDKLIERVRLLSMRVVSLGAPHFDPWTTEESRAAQMREFRTKFADASILVRSVTVDIAPQRTDEEITRMLILANVLDVRHVVAQVPVAMLSRLNDLARRQGMLIGLLNGGRSEIDSVSGFQGAIHSFGNLGIALDAFHLESRGGDPLELLNHNAGRVFEMRFRPVGPRTREALSAIRHRYPNIPMLIDVPDAADIPGSVDFFRDAIRQKPPERPGRKGRPSTPRTKE